MSGSAPMWRCPRCGRSFANRNQTHTCVALGDASPRFRRVQVSSPSNMLHAFRLTRPDEVRTWLAEAYAVGQQQHRHRRG